MTDGRVSFVRIFCDRASGNRDANSHEVCSRDVSRHRRLEVAGCALHRVALVLFFLLAFVGQSDSFGQAVQLSEQSGSQGTTEIDLAVNTPSELRTGQTGQFFVELRNRSYEGLRFDLPDGFQVLGVHVESYQLGPLENELRLARRGATGTVYLADQLTADAVAIITFKSPALPVDEMLRVVPIVGDVDHRFELTTDASVRRLIVRPAAPSENTVLELTRQHPVVEIENRRFDELSDEDPFTMSTWVRTTDIGGIVLSSWTGVEDDAYPVELVVGVDGRLVFYRGRAGEHQSMRSREAVADGAWHHVAITVDPSRDSAFLYVDGIAHDSLMTDFSFSGNGAQLVIGGRVRSENVGQRVTPQAGGMIDGLVDEVGFWLEPLNASAIADLSHGDVQAVQSPLILQQFTPDDLASGRLPSFAKLANEALTTRDVFRSLSGQIRSGAVELSWSASPLEAEYFVVERSTDGVQFGEIGSVPHQRGKDEYLFDDKFVDSGVLFYRIVHAMGKAGTQTSATIKIGIADPLAISPMFLKGNAPNPFSDRTTVIFEIPEPGHVFLSVWDVAGQPVQTLVDAEKPSGIHEVGFEAGELSTGTYFVRLQYDGRLESAKMLLVK